MHKTSIRSLDEIHIKRIEAVLLYLALFCVFSGLSWMLFFGADTNRVLFIANLATLLSGAAAYWMTRNGYVKQASYVLFSIVYLTLVLMCLFLDVPSASAPRVVHNYFLVIALYGFWVYEYESLWLRYGVCSAALLAFIVFSSTTFDMTDAYRIAEEVRIFGAWINNFFVIFILCVVFYVMQSDTVLRMQLGAEISDSLQKQHFELYYQPQVDLHGNTVGAEALLRWNHPQKGLLPPLQFIPFAEKTGLIVPLGYWVLNQACIQLSQWSKHPVFSKIKLSVNVSAQQFNEPDFVPQLQKIVDAHRTDVQRLCLELTESVVMHNAEHVIQKMHAIRQMGISIALDDFGTGYSSLGYLRQLPLDQLKIDKMFVKEILTNPFDAKIANSIIQLAKDLGHSVIAEGVETEAQQRFLLQNGCELFQGYLHSPPIPADDFERYVHSRIQPTYNS